MVSVENTADLVLLLQIQWTPLFYKFYALWQNKYCNKVDHGPDKILQNTSPCVMGKVRLFLCRCLNLLNSSDWRFYDSADSGHGNGKTCNHHIPFQYMPCTNVLLQPIRYSLDRTCNSLFLFVQHQPTYPQSVYFEVNQWPILHWIRHSSGL